MKHLSCLSVAAAVWVAGCVTTAPQQPVAAARAACEPAPNALVTKDIEVGTGRTAVPLASALVFYTGWVYDPCAPDHKGAQFDTNVGKSVPFGFRIGAGRVIKGWDEGLIGMKEGSRRLLVIPAGKAYGEREIAGKIPANSTLVFEVSLVQLQNIPGEPAPSFDPKAMPRQ